MVLYWGVTMYKDNIHENSTEQIEKQIQNIFKKLRSYSQKDYFKIISSIEFYKSKYFIASQRPKKTFREFLQ